MDATLLQLELVAVIDECFIGLFVGEAEVDEVGDEATELVEDEVLVLSELFQLLLLFRLQHPLQLLEPLLEYVVIFGSMGGGEQLGFALADAFLVDHLVLDGFSDEFAPDFDVLPDAVVGEQPGEEVLPLVCDGEYVLGGLQDPIHQPVVIRLLMHEHYTG